MWFRLFLPWCREDCAGEEVYIYVYVQVCCLHRWLCWLEWLITILIYSGAKVLFLALNRKCLDQQKDIQWLWDVWWWIWQDSWPQRSKKLKDLCGFWLCRIPCCAAVQRGIQFHGEVRHARQDHRCVPRWISNGLLINATIFGWWNSDIAMKYYAVISCCFYLNRITVQYCSQWKHC